jgi:hypothetical protein
MATIPETGPQPALPDIPVPDPGDHPERERPIAPDAELAPEATNLSQDDEDAQSQTVAAAAGPESADDFGLSESDKVGSGEPDDDVQDLVDHMHAMVRSGQIDMDAFRGERNDDDEDGALGPGGEDD